VVLQRKRSQGADVSNRDARGMPQSLASTNGDARGEEDKIEPTHTTTDLDRTVQWS
jgi:hypothetical protein